MVAVVVMTWVEGVHNLVGLKSNRFSFQSSFSPNLVYLYLMDSRRAMQMTMVLVESVVSSCMDHLDRKPFFVDCKPLVFLHAMDI